MAYPNTLIFVDFPSPDPEAAARFYGEVFNWEVEPRPAGIFHRIVPGEEFLLDDGSPSGVGNLHMGIFDTATAKPDPRPAPVPASEPPEPRHWAPRVYILVSDDDDQDRILGTAEKLGAEILWRDWYWKEFNGFHSAFRDPWGTEVILWTKGGDDPAVPPGRDVDDLK